MEARPVQRTGSRELSNLVRTSSIPSTPNTSAAEDVQLMSRPLGQTYHLLSSSNGGAVGHICSSSSSGFSTNLHYSSMVSHDKHYTGSSSNATAAHLVSQASSNDSSWCHDSLPGGFLDFPENHPAGIQHNNQIEDSGIAEAFDDLQKRSDWQEWADHLITDEDPLLSTNWNDLLLETSSNSDSKVVKYFSFIFLYFSFDSVFSCFLKVEHCFRTRNHCKSHNPRLFSSNLLRLCLWNCDQSAQHLQTVITEQAKHVCVGRQSFTRLLLKLSTVLVAVKVSICFFLLSINSV